MQLNISIRHGHISEPTQTTIRGKLEKLNRLYDHLGTMDVTIDMEHRELPGVDLRATVKKHEFVAAGQAENLVAAVDMAVDKMEQQLRKHKEKVQDHHRGAGHREQQ